MEAEKLHENGETLLIVDDEPLMTDLFRLLMTKRGFQVFVASGGEEALRLIQSGSVTIRLVITDMTMPNMDGVALARALFALHPRLPILIATGHDTTPELLGAPPNVVEVIHKPYQAGAVAERIREILAAHSQ